MEKRTQGGTSKHPHQQLQWEVHFHAEQPGAVEAPKGVQLAGGATAAVDEVAFYGHGHGWVAPLLGKVEVLGHAAKEVVVLAVVVNVVAPVAGSGEAEDTQEAWVDVGGFLDPVVVGTGKAGWRVDPRAHDQSGGDGEDGGVGEMGEEIGEFGVSVSGVVGEGLGASPEGEG